MTRFTVYKRLSDVCWFRLTQLERREETKHFQSVIKQPFDSNYCELSIYFSFISKWAGTKIPLILTQQVSVTQSGMAFYKWELERKLFLSQNVSGFRSARSSLTEILLNSLSFSSVCSPLLTERRGIAVSCSPGLPAASGEIIRCVPSTPSPWPGRGDGSLCPEPERPQSHEQVSFHFSAYPEAVRRVFITHCRTNKGTCL